MDALGTSYDVVQDISERRLEGEGYQTAEKGEGNSRRAGVWQ